MIQFHTMVDREVIKDSQKYQQVVTFSIPHSLIEMPEENV